MRKGYDCDAFQASAEEITSEQGYSANRELLQRAKAFGGESDDAMRATEELIQINRGLVKKIALRFVGRGVDFEDLMQIGTIGMLKAIRSFDFERGTCFSTYAVPLIFGELRRHMRDEGPIKVGRYYKRLGAQLMNLKAQILTDEGREAHISELAGLCDVDVEEAAMAIDALSPVASLSDSAYGDDEGAELGDVLADEDSLNESEKIVDRLALAQAINGLPPLWKKIVTLRYYRGMTQQQTAAALCVTQVKISREEKKIMEQLRHELS